MTPIIDQFCEYNNNVRDCTRNQNIWASIKDSCINY